MRGKQRKWCPVPLCDAIVIDVGRHLLNPSTHGIYKNSREYQRLLRLAKPYTGLAEMEGNLVVQVPPIVELRQDSSASCPLSAAYPDTDEEDSGTQHPAPSVSASTAHPSARDEVSSSQPPAASVNCLKRCRLRVSQTNFCNTIGSSSSLFGTISSRVSSSCLKRCRYPVSQTYFCNTIGSSSCFFGSITSRVPPLLLPVLRSNQRKRVRAAQRMLRKTLLRCKGVPRSTLRAQARKQTAIAG